MKKPIFVPLIVIIAIFFFGCKSQEKNSNTKMPDQIELIGQKMQSPPVIIYQTTHDYLEKVPVIMDENKERVISYPAPGDLTYKGKLSYPTQLNQNYLLDMRGISQNVAFLDYTYEEYRNLKTVNNNLLMEKIIDKEPLIVMYRCGNKGDYKNLPLELNQMIQQKSFSKCEKLK